MEDMLSLYQYLGRPAGGKVGSKIYRHAVKHGIKVDTRQISNSKYTGKVMMYPRTFLNSLTMDFFE